jgi:hypothetical protein
MVAGIPRRGQVDINPEGEEVQKRMEEADKEIPGQVLNHEGTGRGVFSIADCRLPIDRHRATETQRFESCAFLQPYPHGQRRR